VIPQDEAVAYSRQLLSSALAQDKAGLRLGELGIGLNPSVERVDGRTILDEKAFGTAHIALGCNTPFGGKIASPYHHDLVFFPTSIALDRTAVPIQWVASGGVS
jgi:leucyl aminopeptidase (aminopeptidase T)